MTHSQIITSLEGNKCPACRRKKPSGASFCQVHLAKLSREFCAALREKTGAEYDAVFIRALESLRVAGKKRGVAI